MRLEELRKKPHLSASSINQYIDCSLAYRFSKIDQIKPEFTSDALVFGSAIHKVLEFFYNERQLGRKTSLLDLLNLFEKFWRMDAEGNTRIKFKPGNDFDSMLMEGKSLLTIYYTSLPEDNFKVIGVEEAFELHIPGIPIPLIGSVDLIEECGESIIITDHKTSSKAYSADDIDNSFQLTLYGLAFKMNGYHDREILLKFDCLIKTKKPKFEQCYTVRSDIDEKKAINKIIAVWDGISKGVFIPNNTSWKCCGCSFKQNCEEFLTT